MTRSVRFSLSVMLPAVAVLAVVSGGSTLAQDPAPTTCAPDAPALVKLATLPHRHLDGNPIPGAQLTSTATTVLSADQTQSFDVIVTATNQNAIDAYISDASVCLEAFPQVDQPIGSGPTTLQLILIQAVTEASGLSPSDLTDLRDAQMSAGGTGSLKEMLDALGVDAGPLQAAAIERAATEIGGSDDWAALVDQSFNEHGAPLLSSPMNYDEHIQKDPANALVVTLEPLDTKVDAQLQAIWFVVDPPIGVNGWIDYRAECEDWATVKIQSHANSQKVYLFGWWGFYSRDTPGTSAWTPSLYSPMNSPRSTMDVAVRALDGRSGIYDLAGGWVQGVGGGC